MCVCATLFAVVFLCAFFSFIFFFSLRPTWKFLRYRTKPAAKTFPLLFKLNICNCYLYLFLYMPYMYKYTYIQLHLMGLFSTHTPKLYYIQARLFSFFCSPRSIAIQKRFICYAYEVKWNLRCGCAGITKEFLLPVLSNSAWVRLPVARLHKDQTLSNVWFY